MSEKDGASPVDRYDLKQKIRARDIKIAELERLLEESKAKILSEDKFDWAGQACDLRQEIEARGKIIESLRKELPELVKANADDFLAEKCNQLESECEELQKQNELLREAAKEEDAGPDSKPELRMKICKLMDEVKALRDSSDIETDIGKLTELAYYRQKETGPITYKMLFERLEEKLKEPIKLGVEDKHGVEMKEGDILKMPDGKRQVLSWGVEEKVFYGIGNTVTVVSAGFRMVFDGEFKASDCEIVGQSKIKMHREEI